MKTSFNNYNAILLVSLLASSCSDDDVSTQAKVALPSTEQTNSITQELESFEQSCPSDSELSFICGLMNAEDLLSPGDSGMILTSGMSGENTPGHVYLINPEDNSWKDLLSSSTYSSDQDLGFFPECPGPVDLTNFSAHGLALKETTSEIFDLYITGHGAREAIEVFELNMRVEQAALTWKGCVVLDPAVMHNSVAILPNGGFVTTQFMRWEDGFEAVFNEEPNGRVVMWNPGSEPEIIPGSELSGANGIASSVDGNTLFVAAFGSNELVRFDISQQPIVKQTISLDIMLDNVRWGEPGKLLTAGGNASGNGWSVVEIDAASMETKIVGHFDSETSMQGISSALQVGDEIWVGTYAGDRIGSFPKE